MGHFLGDAKYVHQSDAVYNGIGHIGICFIADGNVIDKIVLFKFVNVNSSINYEHIAIIFSSTYDFSRLTPSITALC